jgi:NAD(P)-dependent dehydrogenase (short-subunit alcohol dehydrogenase family)
MSNYLVIGGSSGIGLYTAVSLKERGHEVWVASRNWNKTLEEHQISHISLDIQEADSSSWSDLPEKLDGMLYCPGSINLKPFQRLKEDDFLNDFRINVLGAVKAIQACLPHMKKNGQGSVVLISTVAARTGMNFHASVATSKAGIEGLSRSLAAEYASASIRFNVIAPSLTDTPLAAKLLNTEDKQAVAARRHPLGRYGTPSDISSLAVYLLEQNASWLTGQVIAVDGGMSALRPL